MELEFTALADILLAWFTVSCLAAIAWIGFSLLFRGKR